MKHIIKTVVLLALAFALLVPVACAEPSDAVKGIYDALLAEGSDYSETKAMYAEFYPDMTFEETLDDNGFTISVSGSESMDGSWRFVQDGDNLTTAVSAVEYTGAMLVIQVVNAAGAYYGMDTDVLSGYINGLSLLGIANDNFTVIPEEDATTYSINIAGPWDMKELDQMMLDENTLYYGPLEDDYSSMMSNIGKIMMVANGNTEDVTILLGEYGGLDDLAFRSIVNVVGILQPNGWEDFVANYTELSDVEADGYAVTLNVDEAAVGEIIEDAKASYSYAIIHFGSSDGAPEDAYSEEYEAPEPAEAPTVEALAEDYFLRLSNLEFATAGASLKAAIAASDVCAFAVAHDLYNPDAEALRANMLAAFETLGEDEQAAFWQGFDTVNGLLEECLTDYDANRALFEDAGVADAMDQVMYDPLNRLAWENLRDNTLAMANEEA